VSWGLGGPSRRITPDGVPGPVFEVPYTEPSTDLVLLAVAQCPCCGADVQAEVVDEPAMFYFGGYGATRRSVTRLCRCGWSLLALVTEVRPS